MHPLIWATLRLTMTSLMLVLTHNAFAGTFEVAPTTMTVASESVPSVFYVTNRSDEPMVAQVEGYDWKQVDGADKFDPTTSLIISPPMVRLLPGQQQTVRLMVRPDPKATTERAFRLVVSEIPDASSQAQRDKIRMLLQFSVPIFVTNGAAQDSTSPLAWKASPDANGMILQAHNNSAQHVKIAKLDLDAAGQKVAVDTQSFRYILAGADSRWTLPQASLRSGQNLMIKAFDEASSITRDTSIQIP